MPGHYFEGFEQRKPKYSESSSSEDRHSDFIFSDGDCKKKPYKKRHIARSDAEVIPKFQPEDTNRNVIGWLQIYKN
ncbi:unnamed protein product [Euphydryas editha]|uniref:Uncharacterized protein n=1 Tax=Euphydryas editha TaxID=104508 RepID=A0AAU9U839_EUPED|nr:unnamed protein product [Euphydryas editha]